MVIRNAAVLPVPVCACPATSLPASDSGSTFSWIGVQCVKPAARMPAITGAGRAKLVEGAPLGLGPVACSPRASLTGAHAGTSSGAGTRVERAAS